MRISVFGLGHVGAVSATCLATEGHEVVGVDPDERKVALLARGAAPVVEPELGRLTREAVSAGRLRATSSWREAVDDTEMAWVCVGTPSTDGGALDLAAIRAVARQIGAALAGRARPFTVVLRSTVLPGTVRRVVIPLLEEASGARALRDFGVCVNPEFLREGSAVRDFHAPPKIVLGVEDEATETTMTALVERPGVPLIVTRFEVAELAKYADNAWHGLKVAFANELGALSKAHGLDGQEVMEVFCADEVLNISTAYLEPGFAFGGSCLPKDIRALRARAAGLTVEVPLLDAILASNDRHLQRAFDFVVAAGGRRIGVLGLSFKAGTDDLRESPALALVQRLVDEGYDVRAYDPGLAAGDGAAARDLLPPGLLVGTVDELLAHAETVVIGTADDECKLAQDDIREDQTVIDLVRVSTSLLHDERYEGICW